MIFIEDNFKKPLKGNIYIALGSFDGLHMGHLKLISETIRLAKENDGKSMIYAFKNHPLSIINKEMTPKLLMDNESKLNILSKLGVDIVNLVDFDSNLMKLAPEEFIKKIVEYYNCKGIIVGFNYRFGYKNLGDLDLLDKLKDKYNFTLNVVPPVYYLEDIVSSSRIRNAISDGEIVKTKEMLTRHYMLTGSVMKGKQLGRTIGFPTVNLNYDKSFVLPKGGVYLTIVEYENKLYKGITNIGYNPTVADNKLSIETFILDFNMCIYENIIKLYFIDWIRDEKKFNSLEELKEQLIKDKYFANTSNIIKI
ncbi:MAG TPA: bifunctional riboflavin kinase/FAD synthetase [Clostridiaceae bacterium]